MSDADIATAAHAVATWLDVNAIRLLPSAHLVAAVEGAMVNGDRPVDDARLDEILFPIIEREALQ